MLPLIQQPPLLFKHSFVSTWSLKQTGGSVVSWYPEQIAFNTAPLSSFPVEGKMEMKPEVKANIVTRVCIFLIQQTCDSSMQNQLMGGFVGI
jgi:hypothetical protein